MDQPDQHLDRDEPDRQALRELTRDIDDQHHEAMRSIRDELGERHLGTADPELAAGRRQFLKKVSLGGAAVVIGGTSFSLATMLPVAAQTTTTLPTDGDMSIVQFAQTLELSAVEVYNTAVATNRLDSVVAESARTFGLHHKEHADALATLAGKKAPNTSNSQIIQLFGPAITGAADQNAILNQLYELEEGAAATYELALGLFEGAGTAGTASSILPVEGQHAVAWAQFLKLPIDQWMPPFQTQTDALDPQRYAAS